MVTHPHPTPPLAELLEQAQAWSLKPRHFTGHIGEQAFDYRRSEFSSYHIDAPQVLTALWYLDTAQKIPGEQFHQTLLYLKDKTAGIGAHRSNKAKVTSDPAMVAPKLIEVRAVKKQSVEMKIAYFYPMPISDSPHAILKPAQDNYRLAWSVAEGLFPGSTNRIKLGHELGLDSHSLARYATVDINLTMEEAGKLELPDLAQAATPAMK